MSETPDIDDPQPLQGKRVAFIGKLGGVTRREARQLVRRQGGTLADKPGPNVDLIVVGADELPLADPEQALDEATCQAADGGRLEIISETQLWQRLGLVESEQSVHRLHTPAMLAELVGVPISVIRRWHRRGLIVPQREVHRLPYFDYQEVVTAQRLAQLLAAGASPAAIEKKLAQLARFVPEVQRPLAQLSAIVEGKQILLRQGEGLIEPGGQLRIDFEALERSAPDEAGSGPQRPREVLSLADRLAEGAEGVEPPTPEEMFRLAAELEEEGHLREAADMYRAVLAAGGPDAVVCFLLAEILYRMEDLSAARERYYAAIELDENYVEARANLGCVLAETGEFDLAVAAFRGTLKYHANYPDVHYHLARVLDEMNDRQQAESHWREFLDMAPNSPWAEEALARLEEPAV